MKKLFSFAIILTLFLSIISTSTAVEQNGYDEIINTFEKTNSKFEKYNINGQVVLKNKFLNFNEMKIIIDDINKNFCIENNKIKYIKTDKTKFRQVYAFGKNEKESISIIVESEKCENIEETHIIVDINKNEVYKDIGDNYMKLKNVLNNYSSDVDIYTCLIGSFDKKLYSSSCNNIAKNVFFDMNAEEKEQIKDENLISITGYTNKLKDYIKYNGNKLNLNVSLRYSDYDDKTFIYIGVPLIVLEY